jgi:cyclophilin family peptidyl-prolyl cis-trans isomerase
MRSEVGVSLRLAATAISFARGVFAWPARRNSFLARQMCPFLVAWLIVACCCVGGAQATIVRFSTVLGNVDVRLYDAETPLSVDNFLNYVTTQRFNDTIIHRSVPGFVIQGGGFRITSDIFHAVDLPADPPVLNEPGISNVRGTLAYAKLDGDPNSATREWFFNLADNSENLDSQNGGFTVFGRVLGSGMDVVDAIASLSRVNAGGAFSNLPVIDLTKVINQHNVFHEDAVNVTSVTILDLPAGDYDFNSRVDSADYNVWKTTFGLTTNAAADGNGDGIVNAADYTIWRDHIGATGGAGTGNLVQSAAVPEPSTGLLFLAGLPLVAIGSRNRLRTAR